jgi:PhnB protein
VHAALQINGSTVLLNDDFPEYNEGKSSTPIALGGTPVTIHLTVTDVDASFQQALDSGAMVAPEDQFWVTATASCVTVRASLSLASRARGPMEEIAEAMKQAVAAGSAAAVVINAPHVRPALRRCLGCTSPAGPAVASLTS